MNAFALPPGSEHEAAIEPGHRAIFTWVMDHTGLSEAAVRHEETPEATDARAIYFWLCDQLKSTGLVPAAFAAGITPLNAQSEILRIDQRRAAEPAFAAALEEACLVLHCEAVVLVEKGFARAAEPSIMAVARKALASARQAGMVPVADIQRLAAAYIGLASGIELRQERAQLAILQAEHGKLMLKVEKQRELLRNRSSHALEAKLRDLITAGDALDRASQVAQPAARRTYEKATEQLRFAAETFFGIERKFK